MQHFFNQIMKPSVHSGSALTFANKLGVEHLRAHLSAQSAAESIDHTGGAA